MKFVIDEQLKHRLIGVVVILAVAMIILPAVMKKSNYRFDKNVSLSIRLPEKPPAPQVAMPNEKTMFETVRVAQVNIPATADAQLTQTVKAEQIADIPPLNNALLAKADLVMSTLNRVALSKKPTVKLAVKKPSPNKNKVLVSKKDNYAVQLASFSQQSNAQALVTQLLKKGYKATYTKAGGKQGGLYKVIVGQGNQRDEAQNLRNKLADSMQLNGFVIKTGVS